MGGRLWPLLALLGTAVAVDLCVRMNPCANGGTCSMVGSAWICRCPGRWRGKRCQAGPEPAEQPGLSPLGPLSTQAKPSPGSWDPGPTARAPPWQPSPAASGAVEMATAPAAAERTAEAASREWAEPATPLGRKGPSPPATATATWLSRPTSPAGAAVLGSSPSCSVEGTTTSPSQGSGTVAGPRSEAPGTAGKATLLPSLHPASRPRRQREGARPTHTEPPGPSLAAGAALPGPTCLADSVAAAALAELAHSGHPAPQTAGPEAFPSQPASSSEGSEESGRKRSLHMMSAGPRKPWPAVGLLLSSTVSPAPPGSSTELDLMEGEEGTLGGLAESVASHTAPLEQRTPGKEWEGPTLTPSPEVSRAATHGPETAPHVTPSSYAAATSAGSPDFLSHRTGHAPDISQSAPSSSSPLSHGGLSAGPTGEAGTLGTGQDGRWNPAALQTSTDPLTVLGTEPLHPQGAPKAPATRQFLEPFSPLPSPALLQHPLNWVTEGGNPSMPASSSSGTSAAGTDRAGLSSDSPKRPPTDAALDSFPRQAASSKASLSAGETTATAAPTVRLALTATWRSPHTTEFQASSVSAAFATKEDSSPTGPPQLPLWTVLFSSTTSAVNVPTSQGHETEALGQFSVTRQAWSPSARTWSWSRADRSESLGSEAPPSPPLPTAETTWHTWPPARADLPVASTWLLAVMPEAATQLAPATPRVVRPRAQHIFVAENQPPALKAAVLHLPWELVLAMEFSRSLGSPQSPESQGLVVSINATVAPLFAPLPGFQRLEVTSIRPGGVVVLLDAVFQAEAPGWRAALSRSGLLRQPLPRLRAANTSVVVRSLALERPLDLCAELFSCPTGYDCVVGEDRNATCASVCHRQYCKNQGICTHAANQTPVCQCPVGSDFWFLGVRCDYRVTQQGLLGVAGGLLLSLLLIGAAIFVLVVRRVRLLLLEARADQTKSSYRRFCRLDDVSAHYWSEPWLASVNSLDNPAFSNSEELLHLQALEPTRCSCREGCLAADGHRKPSQGPPCRADAGRPRSLCSWERSSGSGNEHMVDSGKASEVSVCSWPVEPIQWRPSPARQERACQPTHKSQRPHSYCEGMELVSLERSWTA